MSAQVAIVGAGQAGLVMSRALRGRGIDHVVLEASGAFATSWASRWNSLRLITPGWMNSLPGAPFPGEPDEFAPRDAVVAYLRAYAELVAPPVRFDARVLGIVADDRGVRLDLDDGAILRASAVVLATGSFGRPTVPALATELPPGVQQLTAADYRNPGQVTGRRVLVAGSGNSGAGIAADLVGSHEVVWAMGGTPRFPRRLSGQGFNDLMSRLGAPPLVRDAESLERVADLMWWFNHVGIYRMDRSTPLGERLSAATSDPSFIGPGPDPLTAGATRAGKVVAVVGRSIVTADGARHDVDSVVWATGLRPDLPGVTPPIVDGDGRILQVQGVTPVPGVYVLGMRWMHRLDSGLFHGVAEDAAHLAGQIAARLAAGPSRG